MKPDRDDGNTTNPHARKPWGAILVGTFLSIFGIAAGIYGVIAITWSGEGSSEVVIIGAPNSTSASIDSGDPGNGQQQDGPLRTSSTRRRTNPRSATTTPRRVTTTASEDDDSRGPDGSEPDPESDDEQIDGPSNDRDDQPLDDQENNFLEESTSDPAVPTSDSAN